MIRTIIGIALLVMFIGLIGNAIVALMHTREHLGGTPDQGRRPDFEVSFLQFLAGLALVSVILMITALLGVFSLGNTVAIAAAVAVASWLWGDWRVGGSDVIRGSARLFGIACVAVATYRAHSAV